MKFYMNFYGKNIYMDMFYINSYNYKLIHCQINSYNLYN